MRTRKPSTTQRAETYQVGKGRPPLSTRWKSGQSGNPKGRPKGRKNLTTYFAEAYARKVTIQENGKRRQITAADAMVRRLFNDALLKGDFKTLQFLIKLEPEIARQTTDYVSKAKEVTDPNEVVKIYQRMMQAGGTEY